MRHSASISMKAVASSLLFVALSLPAGPAAASAPVLRPDKLVILSTTDMKGKTSPCGCHTPKGGLSRQASFMDSIKASYGQVMLVDNGGFFPEADSLRPAAGFLMDAMRVLGTDAVGLGDRDLRFGLAYLRDQIERTGLPMVSANLVDPRSRKPVLETSLVKPVGRAKVGVFSLLSDKADLGPARDSLAVAEPSETARAMVAELKRKGATVIVLLSQLGKVESEDLVASVDGIDAVIVGRNSPLLQKGRIVNNTVACYGGEQGQYFCQTVLDLDGRGRRTGGSAEAHMLGPQVGDKPSVLALVKSFEDGLNAQRHQAEGER